MADKNKVLIIGNGGREHALAWKISQSSFVESVFCAPGNGGTQSLATNVPISVSDIDSLLEFAKDKDIDLTIVGPELPLSLGIVNRFENNGLLIFGPSQEGAKIETSKVWARKFLKKIGVASPDFVVFDNSQEALSYVSGLSDCVVKADGLAGGKGAIVCNNPNQAKEAINKIMIAKDFGKAGEVIVVEELLKGEEASVIAFCDGQKYCFLPCARDYKRAKDHDQGLNTGGMGAYAPSRYLNEADLDKIGFTIFQPVLDGFRKLGTPYKGVLYAGLMITNDGIKVLEFNARFGDPETQVQLPLLKSDLYQIILSCIDEDLDESTIQFSDNSCVSVVLTSGGYPNNYQTGEEITGADELNSSDTFVFHAGTKRVNKKLLTNSGRVLNITALGKDIKDAREKVYSLIGKQITFENMHFRKDIASI